MSCPFCGVEIRETPMFGSEEEKVLVHEGNNCVLELCRIPKDKIAAWNRRASSTDTEDGAELEAGHEYLLLASYCGNDNDDCSDSCPCSDCLAMCNIFDANGKFLRELGSNQEMHK
jgi:hypothetical protein